MRPETKDETYPLFGKVSIPRMVLAQFDSINYTTVLSKFGHKVLRDIEVYVFRNQSTWWWTIYLCIFILLREASATTADRYRHARNNFGGRVRTIDAPKKHQRQLTLATSSDTLFPSSSRNYKKDAITYSSIGTTTIAIRGRIQTRHGSGISTSWRN